MVQKIIWSLTLLKKHSSSGRMENREKRARGCNWNHAQTMALAELKSVTEEHGRLVWEQIAQTLSNRYPDQIKTGDQCRRRWDTLMKDYNHIEDYCVQTGEQDHRELDEDELASMKLATAYHPDWYDIVNQVCIQASERKRKERCDDDLMPGKRSESSHSVEHPERPPNRDSLCSASTSKSATRHEQSAPESTTTYAQVSSIPSLEADRLSPEEEVPRFTNGNDELMLEQSATAYAQASDSSPSLEADELSPEEEVPRLKYGNDSLMLEQSTTAYAQVSSSPSFVLEATQLRQHGQVSHEASQEIQILESANLLPHTLAAENGAQLEEPLQPLATENRAQLEEPLQTHAAENGAQHDNPLQYWFNEPRLSLHSFQEYEVFELWRFQTDTYTGSVWNFPGSFEVVGLEFYREELEDGPEDDLWEPAKDSFLWTSFAEEVHCTETNEDDPTLPRKSRLRSVQIIKFFVVATLHSIAKRNPRNRTLMPGKEIVLAMSNSARSTNPTRATRGDKPLQVTQRISKQAASDKKEETMRRKAETEAQMSSSKCVPVGKWCAKWSRKLRFPAFHGQSSH